MAGLAATRSKSAATHFDPRRRSGGHDTVVGVDVAHDGITVAGENTATINHVVATANVHGGNTTITCPTAPR